MQALWRMENEKRETWRGERPWGPGKRVRDRDGEDRERYKERHRDFEFRSPSA